MNDPGIIESAKTNCPMILGQYQQDDYDSTPYADQSDGEEMQKEINLLNMRKMIQHDVLSWIQRIIQPFIIL